MKKFEKVSENLLNSFRIGKIAKISTYFAIIRLQLERFAKKIIESVRIYWKASYNLRRSVNWMNLISFLEMSNIMKQNSSKLLDFVKICKKRTKFSKSWFSFGSSGTILEFWFFFRNSSRISWIIENPYNVCGKSEIIWKFSGILDSFNAIFWELFPNFSIQTVRSGTRKEWSSLTLIWMLQAYFTWSRIERQKKPCGDWNG